MTTEFERLKLMEIESLKKQASETAKAVFDAVMEYLDRTARKHDCPGYDCVHCSLHNERGIELEQIIFDQLYESTARMEASL